eukprot:5498478-Amphidinium_carterae.1
MQDKRQQKLMRAPLVHSRNPRLNFEQERAARKKQQQQQQQLCHERSAHQSEIFKGHIKGSKGVCLFHIVHVWQVKQVVNARQVFLSTTCGSELHRQPPRRRAPLCPTPWGAMATKVPRSANWES